jgi:L,D-transpeptidase catalytic domain
VISPEQLAEALDRIHPRDRELLSLSLRRRVPDEALARLYDCESTEVARRRARAIERLADEMDLQRGEDLGAVLKALLEPGTWSAVSTSVGEEFALEAGGTRLTPVPPPDDAEITAHGPTLAPVPVPGPEEEREAPAQGETRAPGDAPEASTAAPPAEPAPGGAAPEAAPAEPAPGGAATEAPPAGPAAGRGTTEAPPSQPAPGADATETAPAEPATDAAKEAPPSEHSPGVAATQAAPAEPEAGAAQAAPAQAEPAPGLPPSKPAVGRPSAAPLAAERGAAEQPPAEQPPAAEPPAAEQPPSEPVLEMLSPPEREAPEPPRRTVPLALFGLGVASLVGAAGVLGATQFGETNRIIQAPDGGGGGDDTRHFIPASGGPLAAPFPTDPETVSCYSVAYVPRPAVLHREPGGRKRLKITAKTEWGSPRVLGVLEQRGDWLGVQAAELRNGEIAWVRRRDARVDCVSWSLHADLSKRTLFVRRDGRTVRKMRVAIGRKENPTPEGRFTVTDKLRVKDPNSPYGCCVLALSGHQTNLPDYWPGGDRLAVHATSDESSIGQRVSLGCLRAQAGRTRWLIEKVPLGAPIFIRA